MALRTVLRRLVGTHQVAEAGAEIRRELLAISQGLADGIAMTCDTQTPRARLLRKHGDAPLIGMSDCGWRARAVYDGRPINFRDRRLIYFCAQPSYRPDRQTFIGCAEWRGANLEIDDVPAVAPDREARGIDIPAFAVVGDRIVGVYFDDYGPLRTGRGTDTDLVLAESDDGRTFQKRLLKRPFAGIRFERIGLPWILADQGALKVYFRAKHQKKNMLVVCDLDLEAGSISTPTILGTFPRNPINIAVTKRCGRYLLFYGATVGGGFYVAQSNNGRHFDFSTETMVVSDSHEWGWDYYKVCASPDNSEDDEVALCYTSPFGGAVTIGAASFNARHLLEGRAR